ncbi:MAG: hypothetical protein RR363_06415 [Rikenellaceae bacterium]
MDQKTISEIMNAGASVFTEKLISMTNEKIIAPYSVVEHQRKVIDLYRKCFDDFKTGGEIDLKTLTEVQNKLNFAIDHAKVSNLPSDELEALKNDINHLKYELI